MPGQCIVQKKEEGRNFLEVKGCSVRPRPTQANEWKRGIQMWRGNKSDLSWLGKMMALFAYGMSSNVGPSISLGTMGNELSCSDIHLTWRAWWVVASSRVDKGFSQEVFEI